MDNYIKSFNGLIFITSCVVLVNGYSSWMIIGNIALSSPFGRHMCDQMPLAPEQKQHCERHPQIMASVRDGAQLSIEECQHQFRNRRWNCSTISQSQGVFGKIIQRGSREAAFVHAITSAGVTYAVTQACSRGELENCSCDKKKRGPNKSNNFVWGGCSDDIKYGMEFSKNFVDATETDRHDARANMNRHNNQVGRRAVKKFMKRKCKCHGPTATCSTKTCWDELDNFKITGQYLKAQYDRAALVSVRQDGSIMETDRGTNDLGKPHKDRLVFLETSPNYCVHSPDTGSLGTTGRECNNTSNGEDGCDVMCCGRGYDSKRVTRVEQCRCKFHWCCEVVCQICRYEVDVHTCKAESEENISSPIPYPNARHSIPDPFSKKVASSTQQNRINNEKRRKRKRKKKRRKKGNRVDKKRRKQNTLLRVSRSKRDVIDDVSDKDTFTQISPNHGAFSSNIRGPQNHPSFSLKMKQTYKRVSKHKLYKLKFLKKRHSPTNFVHIWKEALHLLGYT